MYLQLAVLWEGWSTEKVGMGRWGIQQQKNCDAASGTRDGHGRIQNLFRGLTTGQLPNMWNCRKTYRINIIQNLGGVCVWEGEGVVLEPLQPHSYLWLGSNILNICWCFGNWMPAFWREAWWLGVWVRLSRKWQHKNMEIFHRMIIDFSETAIMNYCCAVYSECIKMFSQARLFHRPRVIVRTQGFT